MIGQQETIRADAEAKILSGNPTLQFGRRRMLVGREVGFNRTSGDRGSISGGALFEKRQR